MPKIRFVGRIEWPDANTKTKKKGYKKCVFFHVPWNPEYQVNRSQTVTCSSYLYTETQKATTKETIMASVSSSFYLV